MFQGSVNPYSRTLMSRHNTNLTHEYELLPLLSTMIKRCFKVYEMLFSFPTQKKINVILFNYFLFINYIFYLFSSLS